jgi:hypothetical protein
LLACAEIHVQGASNKIHATPSIADVPAQGAQVVGPVFAHAEQITPGIALQVIKPVVKEVTVDVLNGV